MTKNATAKSTNAQRTDEEMPCAFIASTDDASAADATATFARKQGFALNGEDVEALQATAHDEDGALSDQQLDGVSGGSHDHVRWMMHRI